MPRLAALARLAAALAAPLVVAGCSDTCETDADCPDGSSCDGGLCLRPDGAGGTGGTGGTGDTPCADRDADTVCDVDDNCPQLANARQDDADDDFFGDACDPCPADPANDADTDGVCGDVDLCPDAADPAQADVDADGRGDACDPDDDDDGTPDGNDCAPADPAIHPGAPDPCDGADQDCLPGACAYPVTALGEAHRIVDVACFPDTRRCAVVTSTPAGPGSLLYLELGAPIALLQATEVPAPRGVAVVAIEGTPTAWVTGATSVRGLSLAGTGGTLATLATGGVLRGPIAATPDANLGLAALEGSGLLAFDPLSIVVTGSTALDCGGAEDKCVVESLAGLADDAGALGSRTPRRLSIRKVVGNDPALAYLTFEGEARAAVVVVGSPLAVVWSATGLIDPGLAAPVEGAFDPAGDRLYLVGGDGAGAAVEPGPTAAYHVPLHFEADDGRACPTALAVQDDRLFVGGGCASGPGLASFALGDDGLPRLDEARFDRLPGCTPLRMTPVPGLEDSVPPTLAVVCDDADALLLLGRD